MSSFRVAAVVTLRRSIADVQGTTVEQALHIIGFPRIEHVRIGKYIEMNVVAASAEEARAYVEEACRRLLANPVIEDYRVTEVEPVAELQVG
ncbi:MAG: phosphoribosylformylglycinamidine synthase subunit PurS [Candidatus Kapabacteria bacterium]|nr:phosphoribosylformylglycinamidine synthase subunit PurS [Candidatus Kapabacteria bacterium]MCS7169020.1 phosphoribosylformylglycinamidine synthase subunit PurS [Candidatus Kapabacteria bacterium]MDW7997119.1 phosphoribosylformylglycinamidine synthase subunit PurS [Bacteroidota bacterium]MDW8225766.1 phosphoribosylformylglycinamidine synthase subunit PurS [Bacteroidota bacterium]